MRVLICDDMFPAMIETVTELLPADEVRVCRQTDLAGHAPWAQVLIPAMARITADIINSAPDLEGVYGPEALNRLLPETDFLISAVTLTEETRGLLSRDIFSRMKPGAYVINISRGPIVNEAELLAAVDEGLIAGAGLDVLNTEPPDPAAALLNHPRIVITPHTAGVTIQSFRALGQGVADNIERLRAGRPLRNLAQPA